MTRVLLLALVLPVLIAGAAERHVAVLNDPADDDRGSGALVYPQRGDFQPGDLDLLSLRIVRSDDAYRFDATFRNPIRDPASVAGDVGPESLSHFARRGFYAFNLDIYIDQDRVKGSGNTFTLPGRRVKIDESHAWERAVVVTPRPELMRRQLIDTVAEAEGAETPDDVAARIDRSIAFPTEIRVRNRTVSVVVPAAFLAGGRPDTDWSVTAFITGAKTSIEADLDLFHAPGTALERLPLGVMQPKSGRPRDTFGYAGVTAPVPLVDLLAPAPLQQPELLSRAPVLTGVTWSASGATAAAGSARPVTSLTSMPPATAKASETPTTAQAPSPGAIPPAVPAPPTAAEYGPAVSQPPARPAIAERLRQLEDLRREGLISEQEYAELRSKILNDL
jgi:hypothetical protein